MYAVLYDSNKLVNVTQAIHEQMSRWELINQTLIEFQGDH